MTLTSKKLIALSGKLLFKLAISQLNVEFAHFRQISDSRYQTNRKT